MDKNFKLFIFDFDGTIADTLPHIINCIIKCINKFNLRQITNEDIKKYSGAVLANTLKGLGATDEMIPKIKKYYADIFFDDISDIFLYENVFETLRILKDKGYTLALASNRNVDTMIPLLKSLGIFNFFDKIVCENDVQNKKPNPDMIELILKDLSCSKDETLVLGDTAFDILASKNADCKSCYVCHTNKENEEVVKLNPDYVIYNFNELFKKTIIKN